MELLIPMTNVKALTTGNDSDDDGIPLGCDDHPNDTDNDGL